MKNLFAAFRGYLTDLIAAWDSFWFTPVDPAVLSAIRVVTGALLLWTHLIWTLDLGAFFGPEGWVAPEIAAATHVGRMTIDIFPWLGGGWLLGLFHAFSLIVFFLLMIGWASRVVAVLAFVLAVMYATHVTPGAFFGLDKINCLLAMYTLLGPCGARYSLDRLLRRRRGENADPPASVSANIALRLLQLHLCVVYLFSGLGKLQGVRWWDGTATWFAVANTEYRSLDFTWLANHLWLVDLLTHATVFWELFYCVIVWPRLARPWVLLTAVGMHGFIGLGMGMPEFALAMLVANAAFLSPELVRGLLDPVANRVAGLLGGGGST
ncbi:HTTM domain-containing protein [Botrimarina hoheduenensis]|uniref:Vitamin K-dependent gamma-carboxylase n=1 Tax=Botrimarina hoheduenensis TaxID=2528000 RepID=A0A5C5VSH7_9BACT|nr:HTTM domain-containing protein [Botrimarina hoheduenensis]TWT41568.1 Vitamin K-dependent gamma-carboxylase [Botrimarina hoheduenensis]